MAVCATPDNTGDTANDSPMANGGNTGKMWMSAFIIVAYLGWLGHGIFAHAMQYRVAAHPIMYFTVWDMFCGWSGWSFRTHLVAEGESGKFYELTPTPWSEYHPYSDLGREHYDSFGNHASCIGANCLRQTEHEPIVQMYMVEETWSKKFNVPDHLWGTLHEEPKLPSHYFHVNAVYDAGGKPLRRNQTFHEQHQSKWLAASMKGQTERGRKSVILQTAVARNSAVAPESMFRP